jgi:hypothetical protein
VARLTHANAGEFRPNDQPRRTALTKCRRLRPKTHNTQPTPRLQVVVSEGGRGVREATDVEHTCHSRRAPNLEAGPYRYRYPWPPGTTEPEIICSLIATGVRRLLHAQMQQHWWSAGAPV